MFHCMDLHCGGEPARVLLSGWLIYIVQQCATLRLPSCQGFDSPGEKKVGAAPEVDCLKVSS